MGVGECGTEADNYLKNVCAAHLGSLVQVIGKCVCSIWAQRGVFKQKLRYYSWNNAPKDVHILITRTCQCVVVCVKLRN